MTMITDYRCFFRLFLCKDVDMLKERISYMTLESIETESYYTIGDSWIEDESLKKKVLKRLLELQKDLLNQYRFLIHSIEQYGDLEKDYAAQREDDGDRYGGLARYAMSCFMDYIQTYKELIHAQDIYENYPEIDNDIHESMNDDEKYSEKNLFKKVPFSDDYIKKWLKKKLELSRYKED